MTCPRCSRPAVGSLCVTCEQLGRPTLRERFDVAARVWPDEIPADPMEAARTAIYATLRRCSEVGIVLDQRVPITLSRAEVARVRAVAEEMEAERGAA